MNASSAVASARSSRISRRMRLTLGVLALKRAAVEDASDVEASTDIDARHRDARDDATRADVMATADATVAAPRAVGEIVRGVVRAVIEQLPRLTPAVALSHPSEWYTRRATDVS